MRRKDPGLKGKKVSVVDSYVQDLIQIKDIRAGIIETKDKRYVKILEVEPINFNLRSPAEQDNILNSFYSFFRVSNVKMQIKSMTFRADVQNHINNIKEDLKDEKNMKTKEVANNYMNFVQSYAKYNALTRRFFIVLEYESSSNLTRSNEFKDIYRTLMDASNRVKQYLGRCGNNVIIPDDPDKHTMEILYAFYNRNSFLNETLDERMERVIKDTMKARNRVLGVDEIPIIPKVNFIAPRGIEFKSNYTVMDGLYYSFLYIKSNGYKSTVIAGWISKFINLGEGVDVDIFFEKQPRQSVIDKASRNMRINKVNLRNKNSSDTDFEEVGNAYMSANYIKTMMQENSEELYYMNIMITIHEKTLEGLLHVKNAIIKEIESNSYGVRECLFCQKEALESVTPLLKIDKAIYNKSKRNVLTSSASSTYMFTSFQMCDDSGVLLGINAYNNSLCIVDIFNTKLYKNANIVIIGTSGAGKTFTMSLMALRMRMKGIPCYIIAPLKGFEFKRGCLQIGGQYVKIYPGSKDCINIMEIRPPKENSEDILLDGESKNSKASLLSEKIQQINIFIRLLVPDLTVQESQLLDEVLIRTYGSFGIINTYESVFEEDGVTVKQMPILENLYDYMKGDEALDRISDALRKYVTGSGNTFNQQTNVDLDNKYIVFDISELKGQDLPLGMFICVDYVWDKIKEDRTVKKAVFIDETWKLIGSESNKYAAEFVLQIFKIIRGYGGSAVASTQDISDFFALDGGVYGRGIINQSKTKIILNLESEELDQVKEVLKLSKTEANQILNADKGDALLISNTNKIAVSVKASQLEENIITTDRDKIRKQVEEKQKKIMEEEQMKSLFLTH